MNYIELINRFWQVDLEHPINMYDTRLYFFLLHTCNSLGWKMPFGHSDRHLSIKVGCSVNTVRSAKERLKDAGLIQYEVPEKASKGVEGQTKFWFPTVSPHDTVKGRKSRPTVSPSVSYRDTVNEETVSPDDTVKNPTVSGTVSTTVSTTVSPGDTNNKPNKTKHTKAIALGQEQPSGRKIKNKKKDVPPAPKKSEKAEVTPHWKKIVDAWFIYYEQHYKVKPSFAGADSRSLKQICDNLQKRTEGRSIEWTEDVAVSTLYKFLDFARDDKWLNNNFLLHNLNRQLDKIISNGKQTAGKTGTVDAALNKIDELYGGHGQ